MTIEQAIKLALEYEEKVCGVYREAVEKAKDPIARKVFQVLSDEERGHIAYLQSCLARWKETGAVSDEHLVTAIPPASVIQAGLEKLKVKLPAECPGSAEVEMLRNALEVEVETSDFYATAVRQLPPEHRKLFQRFLEIEDGHRLIVQAELDAVTGLGFWFDFQEFALENA